MDRNGRFSFCLRSSKDLKRKSQLKEHENNDGVDGVVEEEASQTNNPFNNPFENLNV